MSVPIFLLKDYLATSHHRRLLTLLTTVFPKRDFIHFVYNCSQQSPKYNPFITTIFTSSAPAVTNMPSQANDYLFELSDKAIDDTRPVRVISAGAGFSGVCAAIRLPQRIPNLELVVYEKNADVGGTWFENRYPGVACDIPSAAYQFTFESWSQWTELYSAGHEI